MLLLAETCFGFGLNGIFWTSKHLTSVYELLRRWGMTEFDFLRDDINITPLLRRADYRPDAAADTDEAWSREVQAAEQTRALRRAELQRLWPFEKVTQAWLVGIPASVGFGGLMAVVFLLSERDGISFDDVARSLVVFAICSGIAWFCANRGGERRAVWREVQRVAVSLGGELFEGRQAGRAELDWLTHKQWGRAPHISTTRTARSYRFAIPVVVNEIDVLVTVVHERPTSQGGLGGEVKGEQHTAVYLALATRPHDVGPSALQLAERNGFQVHVSRAGIRAASDDDSPSSIAALSGLVAEFAQPPLQDDSPDIPGPVE